MEYTKKNAKKQPHLMRHTILFFFTVSIITASFVHPISAQTEREVKARITDITNNEIIVENTTGEKHTITPDTVVLEQRRLHVGDRLILTQVARADGSTEYFITGFVREGKIWALIALFIVVIILVGARHGVRSLMNLTITLGVVILGIIPLILRGWNPVPVTVIGGTLAMMWSIYFSHGINKKSHAAVTSILISLGVTGLLCWIAVIATSLTGFAQEEANILLGIGYENIDMRGLLLAAMIIGALGVLDDIAINQASVTEELIEANPNESTQRLFRRVMNIGRDHTGAIVNTLILAYTGAAFPLVILMTIGEQPFTSLSHILNNEVVATELVRMIVGSIGILLAMPISSIIAVAFLKKEPQK